MSDWIKKKEQEFLEKQELERQKQMIIDSRNYWAELIREIDGNIRYLNETSIFTPKLVSSPIILRQYEKGYEVVSRVFPSMTIRIRQRDNFMFAEWSSITEPHNRPTKNSEIFDLFSDGNHLYLMTQKDQKQLLVPGEVAQHILMPLIETLQKHI